MGPPASALKVAGEGTTENNTAFLKPETGLTPLASNLGRRHILFPLPVSPSSPPPRHHQIHHSLTTHTLLCPFTNAACSHHIHYTRPTTTSQVFPSALIHCVRLREVSIVHHLQPSEYQTRPPYLDLHHPPFALGSSHGLGACIKETWTTVLLFLVPGSWSTTKKHFW